MSFTLASTTEEQNELNRVATLDSDWKNSPLKLDDPPAAGDIPKALPQKVFNELREEQIRQKKEAGPGLLQDDDRDTSKSSRLEQLEGAIEKARAAEARQAAAEARLANAKLGNNAETPAPTEREVGAHQRNIAGTAKYSDYGDLAAEAKRTGLVVSERAARAIEASRNSEDLVYYLMKN